MKQLQVYLDTSVINFLFADDVADAYIRRGVITAGKRDDAMHVAICTVLEFDVLLS